MKTSSSGLGDIGKEPTLENTVYENTVNQITETLKNDEPKNEITTKPAQVKHMFGVRDGHLADTPKNRETLERVGNDESLYKGTDEHGNRWYVEDCKNGGQHWVQVDTNGNIWDGGYNRTPRPWNDKTGLKSPTRPTKPKIKTKGGKR